MEPINSCTSHKGDIAELAAAIWLMRKGYEVFRNVSCVGPADLMAWNASTGHTIIVDVKGISSAAMPVKKDGSKHFPLKTKCHPKVHQLCVVDGEVVGFRKREDGQIVDYWPSD